MIDIIFLAIVAIVIFIRLRNQLGKIDEDQRRNTVKNFMKEQTTIREVIKTKSNEHTSNDNKDLCAVSQDIINSVDKNIKEELELCLQRANVSAVNFLNGANKAFKIITESFAKGDHNKLKPLLSDKILKKFRTAIVERKDKELTFSTKIISINKSNITTVSSSKNFVYITVEFFSEQINFILDKNNNVTEGSKDIINKVQDIWTFKKDCNSHNPNWTISATKS